MSSEKKKRKYYEWNEASMKLAIESVRNKTAGLNEASRVYGVPKATLKRRIDGVNKKSKESVQVPGSATNLPPELEKELYQHILQMENSLYGCTPMDIRRLAYELAEKNKIKHRFNKEKKAAGKKWYYAFMKRFPQLSLRQPRATSMSRATGFNKPTVQDFFEKLEEVTDKHDIKDPQRIFNMDETGLSTVQRKPRKIIAQKGKRQVGAITSGERGTTTTAVCCVSAAGYYVPPLVIFKRKRSKDELRDGAPPGTIFAFNPESGYINKDIYTLWLQHFVETVKPTPEKKVLLLLDGHASHTKNLEAILYAKKHGVVLLSFPAHTTHKLQPLDVAFFKPLSLYYIDETEKWMRQNPGRVVTTFKVSMLFGKAYCRAASVGTAANGFAKTGIYPLNKNIFQDYEFVLADQENEPENDKENDPHMTSMEDDPLRSISRQSCAALKPPNHEELPVISQPEEPHQESSNMPDECDGLTSPGHYEQIFPAPPLQGKNDQPTINRHIQQQQEAVISPISGSARQYNLLAPPPPTTPQTAIKFHVKDVSPGAKKIAVELRQRSRKAQHIIELTSSPYKDELEQAKFKASNRKKPKIAAMESKTCGKRKQTIKESAGPSKAKRIEKPQTEPSTSKTSDIDIEKWFCKICLRCAVEDMIQCLMCKAWVHSECACVKKTIKKFICPLCTS